MNPVFKTRWDVLRVEVLLSAYEGRSATSNGCWDFKSWADKMERDW